LQAKVGNPARVTRTVAASNIQFMRHRTRPPAAPIDSVPARRSQSAGVPHDPIVRVGFGNVGGSMTRSPPSRVMGPAGRIKITAGRILEIGPNRPSMHGISGQWSAIIIGDGCIARAIGAPDCHGLG